jgi:hypothetical protein
VKFAGRKGTIPSAMGEIEGVKWDDAREKVRINNLIMIVFSQ